MVWLRGADGDGLGAQEGGQDALVRRFAEGWRAVFHSGAGRGQGTELTVLARGSAGSVAPVCGTWWLAGTPTWDDALDHLAAVVEREPLLCECLITLPTRSQGD